MAVNLSPVGGVAAQFFDNSGNVLTGGKLYTYLAGTTTPQPTYTTSSGNVAWSNPIILDAAGRVSGSGEIWLTDGIQYKFILRDSNDVLIATYDNVIGINSNFVNFTNQQEIQTATAGQTVFTLTTMQYQPGTNSLSVFVDGVNQYGPGAQYSFVETDSTTVTFVSGLHVGASVKFTTAVINNIGGVDASQVTYEPPFTSSVTTNVEAKLSEYVNVFDFMSAAQIADVKNNSGTLDVQPEIQNCLDYCYANSKCAYLPAGTYLIQDSLVFYDYQVVRGEGWRITKIKANLPNQSLIRTQYGENPTYAQRTIGWDIGGFQLDAQSAPGSIGLNFGNVGYSNLIDVGVYNAPIGLQCTQRTYYTCFINLTIQACNICAYLQSDGGANEFINCNFGFGSPGGCGFKILSGSWKINGGTVDTTDNVGDAFFSVGQNGYPLTASIQISNVYAEGVGTAVELFHFYDNVVITNIYGVERRNALGPNVFENTSIYDGIYIDSQSMMNPQGPFARRVVLGRDPSTQVIDGGIRSIEGGTVQIVNQALNAAGSLSAQNVYLGGNGGTSAGIYFSTSNPEGVVTAAAGSLCIVNTGGGTGSVGGVYKKTGGTGNTGWSAL